MTHGQRMGLLTAVPGTSIDYDWIAQTLGDDASRMQIVRLNYDRWRIDILQQALARYAVAVPLEPMGQGFKDMSPAVEAFEHLALAGRIRHGDNPLLQVVFLKCGGVRDAGGNRKLDKSKAFGRIDVAVAAVMAVGSMKASAARRRYGGTGGLTQGRKPDEHQQHQRHHRECNSCVDFQRDGVDRLRHQPHHHAGDHHPGGAAHRRPWRRRHDDNHRGGLWRLCARLDGARVGRDGLDHAIGRRDQLGAEP